MSALTLTATKATGLTMLTTRGEQGAARPIVWAIAGSDSGGGAGIQADLHTLHDLGAHACTVISAITAQNSYSVQRVDPVLLASFSAQLDVLSQDLPAAAIKIGLLPTRLHVELLAKRLAHTRVPIILDPVAVASCGSAMAQADMLSALQTQLLPKVSLLTPNAAELTALTGLPTDSAKWISLAVRRLRQAGAKAVLVKGGHFAWSGDLCLDYYQDDEQAFWLAAPRLTTPHGHGTGCCLASAIAAACSHGYAMADAVIIGRAYLQQGLAAAYPAGQGPGPLAHLGWPSAPSVFPQMVLKGSVLARQWRLYDETEPPAMVRRPSLPFARTEHQLGLYPVVDSLAWVERMLAAGVKTLQLRIKDCHCPDLAQQIQQAVELAKLHQARLFINDHWQLAIAAGAYGVHLGQEDLQEADLAAIAAAGLRLGISTHGYAELLRARELNPSYIALGHIFATQTKEMPSSPQGLVRLARYQALVADWPTVAIGGINSARVAAVLATGVGSVALVSAITLADDWQGACQYLLAQVGRGDTPFSAAPWRLPVSADGHQAPLVKGACDAH